MQLTPSEKIWALGAGGVVVALGGVVALWPTDPRLRVAQAALSQLGRTDASVYWSDVLPGTPPSGYPKDWCGAFALWAIHQAKLGLDIDWQVGLGFLSENLPTTPVPQIGDIAYFTTNEHHAVVVGYDPASDQVSLVNGNGTGGAVSSSVGPRTHAQAYYNIQSLVDRSAGDGVLPWLVGSSVVAAAAAWLLIPNR